MANFCSQCGRPLADGEKCSCQGAQQTEKPAFNMAAVTGTVKGFWEKFKNQIGIGDPELNQGDAFEKGKQIIPDCVNANESEIPVKQYEVATLQSRILGIPYAKAKGRLQVTNKRMIFRAPGRTIAGRTTLQHEFAIDELAGVEARREYAFNVGDLFLGLIVAAFGGVILSLLGNEVANSIQHGPLWVILYGLIFGLAGFVPFFMIKKQWLLKLLTMGASLSTLFIMKSVLDYYTRYDDDFFASLFGGLFTIVAIVGVVLAIVTLCLYAIKPNLVLVIKTKAASEAINIRRKKISLTGGDQSENTGYNEVLPADDAERCIREINALVNDIQKLGDFGIEKWKK